MADKSLSVRLKADIAGFVSPLRSAAKETQNFTGKLAAASKAGKLDELAHGATLAGAGLVGAFGLAVKAAADFDKEMSGVAAATNVHGAALDHLRQAAIQAGAATQYSATQAAQAETELAKAGVSVGDILGGGLNGALNLAAAGQLSVADSAEIAANAMNQFGLTGAQVPHVADLLAAGAGKASGSVEDLSQALNQSGLVANQAGWSIEQTTGVLAEFANAGLQGSDAGTSLKTMLLSLEAPSSTAAAAMEKYGITAYDAAGKLKSPVEVAKTLQDALGDVSDQERNAALSAIFGSDAIRAASILYQDGAKGAKKWADNVNDAGFASDQAAKLTDNLAGDIERVKGSLETGFIQAGSGANSTLRDMAKAANAAVDQFAAMPGPVQSTVLWMTGLGGTALAAAGAFGTMWPKIQSAREQLAALGPAGEKTNKVLGKTASAVGRAGLALAALQTFSAVMGQFDNSSSQVTGLAKALADYGKTGKEAGAATQILGKNMEKFRYDITAFGTGTWEKIGTGVASTVEAFTGLGSVMDESVYHAQQRMQQTDQALAQLVQSGHADQAKKAFDRLLKVTKEEGGNVNDLKNALPQYEQALGNLTTTQGQAQKTARDHALAEQTLKGSLEEAVDAAGSLEEALKQLNGGNISAEQAAIKAAEAEDAVTESLKKNGKTLNINTDAGRANMSSILDLADAAIEAAQAKYEETGSLDKANATYNQYVAQLRKTLLAAGLTKDQVDELIKKYFQIPKDIYTNVHTNASAAQKEAAALKRELEALNGKHSVVYIDTVKRVIEHRTDAGGRALTNYRDGGIAAFRDGGLLAARSGLLTQADIFAGRATPMVQFAEAATGEEGFVPRNGNVDRSRSIIDTEASWYGGAVQWGRPSSAVAAPQVMLQPQFDVQVLMGTRDITDLVDVRITEHDYQTNRGVGAGRRR